MLKFENYFKGGFTGENNVSLGREINRYDRIKFTIECCTGIEEG